MRFFKEIQQPVNEGPLDDIRARMDARRNPPAEPATASPTTPPPPPPYVAPAEPVELKAGDIIGYRPKNAKLVLIKAKVLKLLSGDRAMVSVSSPTMIARNNGSPVITIGPLSDLDIQNPYKAVAKESVVNEATQDWLPAYNLLVKNDGEPLAQNAVSGDLTWKKSMALSAKDNGIAGTPLANFVRQKARNGNNFNRSDFQQEWQQLTNEISLLIQRAPTMDQMRDAVKQQAADQHQQNLTAIQQQLDLETAPLQHELSVQALLNKAELDQADQKELLGLDMEARLAIIKMKQDLELDAKERLIALEREIEDRKEREDIRKHELELAQAGYKHELAVIEATAEGEYKKAKLEADYQIQIKQLDNIDNAGERQNRLDQINTQKAKELAVINAETKAKVEILQKEVDVEKQQNDARIEQAYMMAFMPIWSSLLDKASNLGKTLGQNISAVMGALSRLSKPVMPTAQKESRYGRRDAYQRDYDSSVAGMGKRQSLAYQLDGGANDEGWDQPERSYMAPQETYYIRFKDTGLVYKQKGAPKSFSNKAGANAYALAMIKNKPSLQGNLLLTVDANDKPTETKLQEGSAEDLPMYGAIIHRIMVAHTDLLAKYGPEKIMSAAEDEAEWVGDVEEIGSSDVSISVKRVIQALKEQHSVTEGNNGSLDGILARHADAVEEFKNGGEMGYDLESDLWDYYFSRGDLRNYNADASEWLAQQLAGELGLNEQSVAEGVDNPADVINVDVPMLIRVMEFAREDASSDVDLHKVAERLTQLSADGRTVTMDDYNAVVSELKTNVEEAGMNTGNQGYDNMLAVMKAVDAGQDATFNLAGEQITLEYPEARFLAGKYKAFLRAGRQEEFLKYMNDPVMFDRLMKQLRDLIDKQKNFKGSVPGERGVTGDVPKMESSKPTVKPLPTVAEGYYYCKISKTAKLIPEGYKKTTEGYITRK